MTRYHHRFCAVILALLAGHALFAQGQVQTQTEPQTQTRTAGQVPNYSVRVLAYFDVESLAVFVKRMQDYSEMRSRLSVGLPALQLTNDPAEIERAERLLATRIRDTRGRVKLGDLFGRRIEEQLKKMLVVEVDQNTLLALKDDNPGLFNFRLNGRYPKDRPLSAVPPNLLELLPDLPEGIEYRFVGPHLILRDMKANIIIDEIQFAISCRDCRKWTADDLE